jgi:16S rRNA (guanine966-N2)-methyltransferase
MRIVGGAWRGRKLLGPAGATRPTADRVRQALFDMLLHASWGGRDVVEGAEVLDVFAGTGALGLEALSRGATHASFIERDRTALSVLRRNIAACKAETRSTIAASDALEVGAGPAAGLVFIDPPYGRNLVSLALDRLRSVGRVTAALIVAETGRDEPPLPVTLLAERVHGAARLSIWREPHALLLTPEPRP